METTPELPDELVTAFAAALREIDISTKVEGKAMTYEEAAELLLGVIRWLVRKELQRD